MHVEQRSATVSSGQFNPCQHLHNLNQGDFNYAYASTKMMAVTALLLWSGLLRTFLMLGCCTDPGMTVGQSPVSLVVLQIFSCM